jgi:hypothetical protein
MTDQIAELVTDDEAIASIIAEALIRDRVQAFLGKPAISAPKKAERKRREKQVRNLTDGRSLRQKGRTVQFNVMIKPEIKQAILDHVDAEGISMADFTERAFLKGLGRKP